jgi:katanin p80 WD40 repeat-containing subunit B1
MPECRFGLQVVRRFWIKNDARGAVEAMKKMTDHSVIISNPTVFFDGHAI